MLPQAALNYLTQAAKDARTSLPAANASLFQAGVLDSFSLVDFVSLLEKEYDIQIDDKDLRPENFDTIAKIETYLTQAGAIK
jgi:acyl carrier protein